MVKLITVTSGSGGMGKSVFSCNLAYGLRSLGNRVLLAECSFGIRADDEIMGIKPDTLFNLSDICMGKANISEAIIRSEDLLFPDFIAPGYSKPDVDFKAVFQNLKSSLSKEYDYIVFDVSSSAADVFEAASKVCDIAIILTDDSFISIRNSGYCARLIHLSSDAKVYTVVNNVIVSDEGELCAEDIADEISAQILGIIPYDEHIKRSVAERNLIYKYNTFAGRAIENICKRLTGTNVFEYETGISGGFFNKNKFILK